MSSPLKPFIIALVFFILMDFGVTFTPIEAWLNREYQNALTVKLEDINKFPPDQSPDILFLGSSRVNNGFDTITFEKLAPYPVQVYNLGLPTGDYYLFALLLENYLKKHKKPKLLLIELNDFGLKSTYFSDINSMYYRTLLTRDPLLAIRLFPSPLLSFRYKKEIFFNTLSGIYRYRSLLAPNYLAYIFRRGPMPEMKFMDGWSPRNREIGKKEEHIFVLSAKDAMQKLLADYQKTDTRQLEYLLNVAKKASIPTVLVEFPNHPSYQTLFDKSPYRMAFADAARSLQEKYQISIINLNTQHPPDVSRLFFDARHLNAQGATYYTKLLAANLFQSREIEDIR